LFNNRLQATVRGNVQISHKGLDGQVASLTGGEVEAVIEQTGPHNQPPAEGLALGGPMELRRIHGREALYIRTPQRQVECDDFDYDLMAGIARLSAAPGRLVSVITADRPIPVQAESFVWDMVRDTIRVRGAAFDGGR
jgi:hypothetical protein